MRFGTCNVGSLYTSESLTTVIRELVSYKFDLVGIQEVRWDRRGTVGAGDFIFLMEKKIINRFYFICNYYFF